MVLFCTVAGAYDGQRRRCRPSVPCGSGTGCRRIRRMGRSGGCDFQCFEYFVVGLRLAGRHGRGIPVGVWVSHWCWASSSITSERPRAIRWCCFWGLRSSCWLSSATASLRGACSMARRAEETTAKRLLLAVVAGVLMSLFYRFVVMGMDVADFHHPAAGMLTPIRPFSSFRSAYWSATCFSIRWSCDGLLSALL